MSHCRRVVRAARCHLYVSLALAASAASLAAQSWTDKLSIHGYITQGAAKADTGVVIGIPKDGTTDYRRVALLLRYAATANDRFVLQIAQRRLGDSPSDQFEENVKIDWAFYERQLTGTTRLRVGRVPLPLGIYNEIRYVGTLLPFYRAPYDIYSDGTFTSETVDGLELMQTVWPSSPWRLELKAFGGSYTLIQAASFPDSTGTLQYHIGQERAEDVVGGQGWLSTPLVGLRVGFGGQRYTSKGGPFGGPNDKEAVETWQASVDETSDWGQIRGEYRYLKAGGFHIHAFYVQAGARVWGPFHVNGQFEYEHFDDTELVNPVHTAQDRDRAVGVSCFVSSSLVVKLEGHFTRGHNLEDPVARNSPLIDNRYGIASLSMSF
jgi:hypothetical protein